MITSHRQESWGRVVYERERDEFEAHVHSGGGAPIISRPLSAGCLVTGRCNLRCEFCYGNREALSTSELGASGWMPLFAKLSSWGLMRVDLSGGEPTLLRDLDLIAKAAVDLGLQVVVSTNGTVLSDVPPGFPSVRWHVSLDSGIPEVHERSRLLPVLTPSRNSFKRSSSFILRCLDRGLPVRVLTCVGKHNMDVLFALGEHLALLGVQDWNVSRILHAGRAQTAYAERWDVPDSLLIDQVQDLRHAYPFMNIRYSNRTGASGYFLLVTPDGNLATQYADGRDKVILGRLRDMTLRDLQNRSEFDLREHGSKWLSACLEDQPDFALAEARLGGFGRSLELNN